MRSHGRADSGPPGAAAPGRPPGAPSGPHGYIVPAQDAGQRLDWVLSRLPGLTSREMAQRLLAEIG